ncbi:hypothetical protein ASC97_27425 [Rhizobium sp. Root1203]|nr:hypothetical protein ASC97_27425 [Rhizobium sp. Root1203]
MQHRSEDRYIELTTRLRSVEAFCQFLSEGGTVRIAENDGAAFEDVTRVILSRQKREAEGLRKMRRNLFPESPDDDFPPSH